MNWCNTPQIINGGTLKSWTYHSSNVNKLDVVIGTEGRPFDADIQVWNGPDNAPARLRVYSQNGKIHKLRTIVQTPRHPNTLAIHNLGSIEFPLCAHVTRNSSMCVSEKCLSNTCQKHIQGGAFHTYSFGSNVTSVQLLLKTNGCPLNARIELLQGPNTNKEVVELYCEDGLDRPFFCYMDMPENKESVIRVVNTGPIEFPVVVGCALQRKP